MAEATIMKDFHHPNVLTLYGVVILQNKPYVLLPLMENGDLQSFVRNTQVVRGHFMSLDTHRLQSMISTILHVCQIYVRYM